MKAKYLFYSLALASAFTACTQDELFDAPALENNNVAGRPVAGVVTFVGDEVESRYNSEAAKFENGDQMGLYLMDEFKREGEPGNANYTHWNYQSSWWNMYGMVNYINSNYGYVFNSETNEWVNRASQLVEGNYIAMFPQNKVATNRRDLWHPIKANLDLVAHSSESRYYVNRENQFFVGYEQIKRDQKAGEETGELRAAISMKPILTYLRMYIDNDASDKMRVRKVVFTKADKSNLPNVAYVKPMGIEMTDLDAQKELGKTYNSLNPAIEGMKAPYWAWTNREEMAKFVGASYDCDGNITSVAAQGLYDRATFTHAAARSMVEYAVANIGNAPYGMTDTSSSKEYTFNFPGNGVELAGNYESNTDLTKVGISIALPAFNGWNEMKVVVYADKWDGKQWVAGYISEISGTTGELNAAWNLSDMTLWDNDLMSDFPTATLAIDNGYFTTMDEIEVGSDKDFYNLIKGRLADADTNLGVDLTVKPYNGTTLNVNQDVVDLIDAYAKKNGANKIKVTFKDGKVKLNAENSIHKFNYSNVELTLNADQTITEPIEIRDENKKYLVKKLTNGGQSTLTVLNSLNTEVHNNGYMIVKKEVVNNKTMAGYVAELYNYFNLTLGKGANIEYMENQPGATTNVEAGEGEDIAYVNILRNNGSVDRCDNCRKAELNINAGELFANTLHNFAVVNNESILRVAGMSNQELHVHSDGIQEAVINNNGSIVGGSNYGVTYFNLDNYATVNNSGNIEVILINHSIVNGLGGNVEKLQNDEDGIIYIKSADIHVKTLSESEGKIVFEGVINQFVGTEGSDTKIYQTTADIKDLEIDDMMTKTGVTVLWLSHNVTVEQNNSGDAKWSAANRAKLEGIVVKQGKTVTLTSDKTGTTLNVPNAKLTVESEAKLKVNNAMKVIVKSYSGNIDLGSNSTINGTAVHSGN